MLNSENNGITLIHSLSSTFRFGSLNHHQDNDDGALKIYSSFYKYNFVMFIITYLLYANIPDSLVNMVTLLSSYFLMAKGGNVIYNYMNDSNYSFIDSFQLDCMINLDVLFSKKINNKNNFSNQLMYVLDAYPFLPMNLKLLSQLFNTLVLFAVHFIDLFIFFNLGFIPIISLPFAGCMMTHYYNTSNNETVENMVLSEDNEEETEGDSEDTEDDTQDDNLVSEEVIENDNNLDNNFNNENNENDNDNEIESKKEI